MFVQIVVVSVAVVEILFTTTRAARFLLRRIKEQPPLRFFYNRYARETAEEDREQR